MALCLKNLEERKEEEDGNRRSIEEAVNDVKVKCGFVLHWMIIFQGETFCFLCSYSKTPPSIGWLLYFPGEECIPCIHHNILHYQREGRGGVSKDLILISLIS